MSSTQDPIGITAASPRQKFFDACQYRNEPSVTIPCSFTTVLQQTVRVTRVDSFGWCVPGNNSHFWIKGVDSEGREFTLTMGGHRHGRGSVEFKS